MTVSECGDPDEVKGRELSLTALILRRGKELRIRRGGERQD